MSVLTADHLPRSVASAVRRRNGCRAGLVGCRVGLVGMVGPSTIRDASWINFQALMLLIEHDEDHAKAVVPAEVCYFLDKWPVTCCAPTARDVASDSGAAPHPLDSVVLPLLWEVPGLDASDLGRALSDSTERDEATVAYETVAADVLRGLHHRGVIDRDEAGRYHLARPACPAEQAEIVGQLAENGETHA